LAGHSLKLLNSPCPNSHYQLKEKFKLQYTNKIFLPSPIERDIAYTQVISSRQSNRTFTAPLELTELSTLLWDVLKIKKIDVDVNGTVIWNHRGAPSAGGLSSIETFIVNIAGHKDSIYYYNPYDHTLEELDISQDNVQNLVNTANNLMDASKATLFVYASDTENLFLKYQNAESLLWRDVGAIYALANLTCESLQLNSCALGLTFHSLLNEVLGLEEMFFGVGGQVFGHK
jgi:SagB-type dehydrogenase family enzyme